MKIIYPALVVFGISAATAQTRVIGIQDWNGSHTARSSSIESDVLRCAEACPEYSIDTTLCPAEENMVLESCPVKGCRYYHRCVSATETEN